MVCLVSLTLIEVNLEFQEEKSQEIQQIRHVGWRISFPNPCRVLVSSTATSRFVGRGGPSSASIVDASLCCLTNKFGRVAQPRYLYREGCLRLAGHASQQTSQTLRPATRYQIQDNLRNERSTSSASETYLPAIKERDFFLQYSVRAGESET
jgi:hypothetical protein